jgi:signal transduction histidine kinase
VSLQSTLRYVDPLRERGNHKINAGTRAVLLTVNQKVAAKLSLNDVVDFLFERTRSIIPCDRIGLAFVEDDGHRIVSHYARADYQPLLLTRGYAGDLRGSSLEPMIKTGKPRIVDDLVKYLEAHPGSHSTRLLVGEGVRSSLTCPLIVEGRVLGFLFRSSRQAYTYTAHHVELEMAISERLSQAAEKAWRIEQLTAANHAYLEMLAFVSHEIKNPVASIVTDARLLADGYLGELDQPQKDKLERLIGKAQYLLELAQDYLDLARVDGGQLVLEADAQVDVVGEVVLPAIDIVRSQIDRRSMHVELSLPDECAAVECDSGLLRIVLVNLLSNAVKYGNEGGEIRVAVVREPSRLAVSVWNEGQGFPPEDRARLFRRFSRLRSTAAQKKGTGVGLYSAWRIIQLHHGRIRARSEQGAWAEFSFELSQPLGVEGGAAENTDRHATARP